MAIVKGLQKYTLETFLTLIAEMKRECGEGSVDSEIVMKL